MAESGLERPKQPRSLPRYIERDAEIAKVLRAAAEPDPNARNAWPERDIALAAVLAGTGIRASELCRLRIRDLVLDIEDPYLRVTGKGGAVRDCPLAPEVVATLEEYLVSREKRTKRRAGRNAPVWLNNRDKPLTTSALDYHVRGWYERAKVPHPDGAATHAFRHTVAMQLVNRGEPVSVVQALLGHASLSSTQIYSVPAATMSARRHMGCQYGSSCGRWDTAMKQIAERSVAEVLENYVAAGYTFGRTAAK